MPVRSLNSPVLKWPDQARVDRAARHWIVTEARRHLHLLRTGYFGSYARGDWGVGSDLDLVALVKDNDEPFERRANHWDLSPLPVPAELLIYTEDEWNHMQLEGSSFFVRLLRETVWIYPPTQ